MEKLNVLLVDDQAESRDLVQAHIEGLRLQNVINLIYASEVEDAKAVLHSQHVDAILADLKMPNANGVEHVKALHKIKPLVPILIFSMYLPSIVKGKIEEAGAVGSIDKTGMSNQAAFGSIINRIMLAVAQMRLKGRSVASG